MKAMLGIFLTLPTLTVLKEGNKILYFKNLRKSRQIIDFF